MKKRIWLGAAAVLCIAALCAASNGWQKLAWKAECEKYAAYNAVRPSDKAYEIRNMLEPNSFENGNGYYLTVMECKVNSDEVDRGIALLCGEFSATGHLFQFFSTEEKFYFHSGNEPKSDYRYVEYEFDYVNEGANRKPDPFLDVFAERLPKGQRLLIVAMEETIPWYGEQREERMKYRTGRNFSFFITKNNRVVPMGDAAWQQEFMGMSVQEAAARLTQMAQAALKDG